MSWSHVAVKAPKGKCFFKLAIGQNLQNEGRALFLCIYLYYICTDLFFFLVPKMKENFDIWDARKNVDVILLARTVLVFGDLKKK